ncbi:TPA: type II toxin-antitoxin system RelB family antitoxin [Enterococcus faecium]
MATITVRVSEEEKEFLDKMAKFEGKSLSDLLKTKTLENLEDAYDAHVGDSAYKEYLKNPVSRPLGELMKEMGIED